MGSSDQSVSVEQQTKFNADGTISLEEGPVETQLDDFDIEIGPQRETRIERARASEFGIDDRPGESQNKDSGSQANLFADVEEGQETLSGKDARNKSRFDKKKN